MAKSIIQSLKDEGSLVLFHDYRSGSFVDRSGNGNIGVPTATEWTGNGINFQGTARVTVADSPLLQLVQGCLVVVGDFGTPFWGRIISKRDVGGTNFDWYMNAGTTMNFYDGTDARTITASLTDKRQMAVNFADGEVNELFLNGISEGNFSGTSSLSVDNAPLQIGNDSVGSLPVDSVFSAALIINRKLTATEHSQLYAELESLSWPKGSTMISNADLKVDPEPPKANGVELLVDGDMEAATTAAWTATNATLSKQTTDPVSGTRYMRALRTGGTSRFYQTILTIGKTYRFTGYARSDGTNVPAIYYPGNPLYWEGTTSISWQRFDITLVADATSIGYYSGINNGNYCEYDDLEIQEVTGLVAGYNMKPQGDRLIDLSSNGTDGTISGARYEKTLLGDSLVFSGSTENVQAANTNLKFEGATDDFTLSFWCKLGTVSPGDVILDCRDADNDGWAIRLNTGGVFLMSLGATDISSASGFNDTLWHHVAVVVNRSGNTQIYVDASVSGSPVATSGITMTIATSNMTFGKSNYDATFNLDGSLSNFKIFNEVKDQTWITKEYNKGKTALFKTDFGANESIAAVTAGNLENTPFQVDSGSFKVVGAPLDPNDLGVERVTDGDMEAVGTANYGSSALNISKDNVIYSSGTQSMKGEKSGAGTGSMFLVDLLIVGTTYRVTGQVKSDGTAYGVVNQLGVPVFTGGTSGDWEYFDEVFVCTAVQPLFQTAAGTAGNYVHWDNLTIQEVLPNTKAIECVTSGVCYIPTTYFQQTPTEAAYGGWSFWLYKAAVSTTDIMFIADLPAAYNSAGQNGYLLQMPSNAVYSCYEVISAAASSKLVTAAGTVPELQWTNLTISRSGTGVMLHKIDGIALTATGGSNPFTDNTITSSKYMTFDLGAGDKIALGNVTGDYSITKKLI